MPIVYSSQTDAPIELQGSGAERRAQFEGLMADQQAQFRDWFLGNRFNIFEASILDDGSTIHDVEMGLKAAEAGHFAVDVARHGFWRSTPSGLALYVGGKVVMSIPKAVARDRVINYRMARRAFDSRINSQIHSRMATGGYTLVNWDLYNIQKNADISVDFYYWVTDQVSIRPPTCAANETC